MEEPKLNPHYQKLAAFVGTWIGEDTMHPAPWSPQGGHGTTTYKGQLALDGFFVIGDDVQEQPGRPPYLAHKVFGWDNNRQEYTFYLVDSTGQNPAASARGKWEGNIVTFIQPLPMGQIRYRYTFDSDEQYTFQMASSQDGSNWLPLIDGIYQRQ